MSYNKRESFDFVESDFPRRVNVVLAIPVAIVAIGTPLAVGAMGTLGSSPGKNCTDVWYKNIDLPPWMPPGWVFGVVWTILYILMGIASFLIWLFHWRWSVEITVPMLLYVFQLVVNGLFTPVFFGQAQFKIAAAIIGLLIILVGACIIMFWRIHISISLLMVPYIIWLFIALSLNVYIAIYNPDGIEANLKPAKSIDQP